MTQRTLAGLLAAPLLVALWVVAMISPLPYVTYQPGVTVDVLGDYDGRQVIEVDGHKTYPNDGELRMTTVLVSRPHPTHVNLFELMAAWVDRDDAVYPYDWAKFLHTRLETPGQPVPLGGIERGGYRLVWKDEPNPFDKARMAEGKFLSLYHSLGLTLDKDGKVMGVRWDSPAFNAGIVTGARIVAVNGTAYDQDGIRTAIAAGRGGKPIDLLIQRGERYQTIPVTYRDGLRWPWLEKLPEKSGTKAPAGLDALLMPRRAVK